VKEGDNLERLGVCGRIILKVDFKEMGGRVWIACISLRMKHVSGCCECGNEPSGSIKCREFLD
jgi:hypothetical protein